jgi:general secretion pathway protein D
VTNFWRHASGALLILTLITGCAADKLHREGLAAIERGDYETGVADLNQAVVRDPANMAFRLDFEARRESAVQTLVAEGDTARRAGQFDGATALYRRVLAIDPNNYRGRHGLEGIEGDKRHGGALEAARKDFERKEYDAAESKVRAILHEDPGYVPAQELAASINVARGPITVAPRLQTRENRKVTLQLRDAPTKMVFEVLQRETGINFILDKDVKSDSKTSIFVQDLPVEEAIDLVLEQSQLARQILADNMVIIYPNIPAKQKDYEQQIVRTFYLTNAAPKEVESMLKTVLAAKTLFIDERSNVLVMRDTPDAVRMAEKLVASVDVAEPEVMLELEVLEISRSRIQDLGIQYPGSATLTPLPLGTAATGARTGAGLVLSDLSHQNSNTIGISALSVTVNAMKQAGLVNTLASPRIRARNKEKAKVLIGTREPVITNSVTPTAAGAPVVTGSVQYLDVGLTLEVQPTIYLDTDVAVKINLEVSSLLKQVTTASGTIAYEIGTRNANTLLRLKDGETQILAGLIQDTDTRSANSIPLLGDIPILSHLFGTNHTDREKTEIVLSITPRIIRMQTRPANDTTEFWYGSESRTRSRPYISERGADTHAARPQAPAPSPPPGIDTAPAGAPVPNSGLEPVNPSVAPGTVSAPLSGPATRNQITPAPVPQGLPVTAPPAPIVAAVPTGTAAAAQQTQAGAAASGAGVPSALTVEGPAEAKVGEEFDVHVQLSSQEPITHLHSQLRFDSSALQIVNASTGGVVPAGAGGPTVNTRGGIGAQLDVKTPDEDPVQGTGTLMTVRFKAVAPRQSSSVAAVLNVLGGTGAAVGSSSAQPLTIVIHP